MITGSIIFCLNCGSAMVDVWGWETPNEAKIHCSNCSHESTINGFTIGRSDLLREQFVKAVMDVAVYKQDASIIGKIYANAQEELAYESMVEQD